MALAKRKAIGITPKEGNLLTQAIGFPQIYASLFLLYALNLALRPLKHRRPGGPYDDPAPNPLKHRPPGGPLDLKSYVK